MLRNSGGLSGMKSPENAAMAENFDLLLGNQPWGMAMDGDGGWSFCNPKAVFKPLVYVVESHSSPGRQHTMAVVLALALQQGHSHCLL